MTSTSEHVGGDELTELVRPDEGVVSRLVFTEDRIYRRELDRIFTKAWLYIGHESQLKEPGDYFTTYMGEDPVIATRGTDNKIRVLLNSCSHRGLTVCRTDCGSAKFFRCSYHGWTYSNTGELVGVTRARQAYHGELDRSTRGLLEVPRVESYRGMIFASWDPAAMTLVDYLGADQLFYLDMVFDTPLGDLEILGPTMKFRIKANWKLASENSAGDDYHVIYTHGSAMQIGFVPDYDEFGDYVAYFPHGHGMGDIPKPGRGYENDMGLAKFLGPEAVGYLEDVRENLARKVSPLQAQMHHIGEGNIFPNLSWLSFGVFHAFCLMQWHPKGPGEIEAYQTAFYDTGAPQSVRDYVRVEAVQENTPAGIFGQDDGENFEQITESVRGLMSQRRNFDYSMGVGHEGEVESPGYPGKIGPHYTEQNQRNFYRYWLELMTTPGSGE